MPDMPRGQILLLSLLVLDFSTTKKKFEWLEWLLQSTKNLYYTILIVFIENVASIKCLAWGVCVCVQYRILVAPGDNDD